MKERESSKIQRLRVFSVSILILYGLVFALLIISEEYGWFPIIEGPFSGRGIGVVPFIAGPPVWITWVLEGGERLLFLGPIFIIFNGALLALLWLILSSTKRWARILISGGIATLGCVSYEVYRWMAMLASS